MSGRSVGEVWKALWQSLKQSTKNRGQLNEIFVGKDQYGNKYFERMAGKKSSQTLLALVDYHNVTSLRRHRLPA